jgi:hypothetical protein
MGGRHPTHDPDDFSWVGAEYYSQTEASALLRVSARTLHRWANNDVTLPVLKLHGKYLYPAKELRHWLAMQQAVETERRLQRKGRTDERAHRPTA